MVVGPNIKLKEGTLLQSTPDTDGFEDEPGHVEGMSPIQSHCQNNNPTCKKCGRGNVSFEASFTGQTAMALLKASHSVHFKLTFLLLTRRLNQPIAIAIQNPICVCHCPWSYIRNLLFSHKRCECNIPAPCTLYVESAVSFLFGQAIETELHFLSTFYFPSIFLKGTSRALKQ